MKLTPGNLFPIQSPRETLDLHERPAVDFINVLSTNILNETAFL